MVKNKLCRMLGLAASAGVATAALLGTGALGASASPNSLPNPSKTGPLKVEANISLGEKVSYVDAAGVPVAEAPNGAVFYANGSVVYVVETTGAPQVAEHASGQVIALAANATDLYVEVGLTVTDYSRSRGNKVGSWTLPSSEGKPTSAGLIARSGVVWSWVDAATDTSGFEFATLTSLLPGWKMVTVDHGAYPNWIDSDENGYVYYEDQLGLLVHASPTGAKVFSGAGAPVDAPLVISQARLVLESFGTKPVWSTWYLGTLKRISSNPIKFTTGETFANTGANLIGWIGAGSLTSATQVGRAVLTTGALSDTVALTAPVRVLEGFYPVVITDAGGVLHLVRLV
jgi:hypothetical protein